MKMKLTEDDYLLLFPLLRPTEIVAEFKDRSHCSSQIRNKYRKLRYRTQASALRLLKQEIIAQKPIQTHIKVWRAEMLEELDRKKQEAIQKVWSRLNDRLKLYVEGQDHAA